MRPAGGREGKHTHAMFPFRSNSARLPVMHDSEPTEAVIQTRDDLLKLIADAIRLQLTYLSKENAMAVADTILRAFKVAGLSIRRGRKAG